MLKYFFTERSDIPADAGFGLFSLRHFLSLGVSLLIIHALCAAARKKTEAGRVRMLRTTALVMTVMECCKDGFLTAIGKMGPGYLPLHLCSFSVFVLLLYAFLPASRLRDFFGEVAVVLLLPGAVLALLFPEWRIYPVLNYLGLHSLIWHTFIVAYTVILFQTGMVRPTVRHIWYPVVFIAAVIPFIMKFNRSYGTNFFFVSRPLPGTPLEWMADQFGSAWLAAYAVSIFLVVLLVYGILRLIRTVHPIDFDKEKD